MAHVCIHTLVPRLLLIYLLPHNDNVILDIGYDHILRHHRVLIQIYYALGGGKLLLDVIYLSV